MKAEIVTADIRQLSLPSEKLESERDLDKNVEGESLLASLNICKFNDSANSLQIISLLRGHEFETQSKCRGVERSYLVRVQAWIDQSSLFDLI